MDAKITQEPQTPEQLIDSVRLMSTATGKLYDIQILNLKAIPLVLFGDKLSNEFQIDFDQKFVIFTLKGQSDYPEAEGKLRFEHLVKYVQKIIGNFKVSVILNKKAFNGTPISTRPKSREKPKPSRKKRLRKVRK